MKYMVTVKPNAKKTMVIMPLSGKLLVQVKSPPQDGKANEAVVQALAQFFKVPQSHIKIKQGITGKKKLIEIQEI
jgi:uncharacterized protein (TIGR00251 family)